MADYQDDMDTREFARSLIREARADVPTAAAYRRASRALATGLTVGGAVSGASVVTTTAAAAPKLSVLAFSLAAAIKWGAVGVGVGVLTVGAARQIQVTRNPSNVANVALAGPPAAAPVATSHGTQVRESDTDDGTAIAESAIPPPPESLPAPSRERVRVTDRRPIPPAPAGGLEAADVRVTSADDLASEVALLDEVRSALVAHAPEQSLVAMDRYRARWPKGRLALEATVLRIEALLQAGRRAQALELGREFLTSHPRTPFARRVRALVGDAP